MQAVIMSRTGGPEVLEVKDVPIPSPQPGQVLVRMHAAGINYIDVYQRDGQYPAPLPYTPGFEGAGVVTALGAGVTDVSVGARIAFNSQPGAYAEYAVVDAAKLIPLPDELSFLEGAAFPLQALTAHYLLHDYRTVGPGMSVLIHAAAGGMGLLLTQWAKHLGATVFGTVSTPAKAALAQAAGADHIINYVEQDFVAETQRLTKGRGIDLIVDGVGKTTFAGNLEAAATFGHIVIYGYASGPADMIAPNALQAKSLTISGGLLFNSVATRPSLLMRANVVFSAIKAGWLKLPIEHVLPLAKADQAHRLIESRASTGKILLSMSE